MDLLVVAGSRGCENPAGFSAKTGGAGHDKGWRDPLRCAAWHVRRRRRMGGDEQTTSYVTGGSGVRAMLLMDACARLGSIVSGAVDSCEAAEQCEAGGALHELLLAG